MLIVYGKEFTIYTDKRISQFEDAWLIGRIGKAYLRSIVEAKSKHSYKDWMRLGFSCLMRDKMQEAALSVNARVTFVNTAKSEPSLDWNYWINFSSNTFVCTTKDYATAVRAALSDPSRNGCECLALSHLIALRALQLAVGNDKFNVLLNFHLGNKPLEIPLNLELTQDESLAASLESKSYEGDSVFRPGDIIAVSNNRDEADYTSWEAVVKKKKGTPWRVENGICIGWKMNSKGEPEFNEPLFVGGGLGQKIFTEAEIKEEVYNQTKSLGNIRKNSRGEIIRNKLSGNIESDNIIGDRKGHFLEKALDNAKCIHKLDVRDSNWDLKYGLDVVPDISLYTEVKRISILGGRRDLG
ncbi:MAG: hypothetical protein ACFFCW_18395 [Candidatus Hodarchaeota archaeon]